MPPSGELRQLRPLKPELPDRSAVFAQSRRTPMSESETKQRRLPPQAQSKQPGVESTMKPPPDSEARHYKAAGKLEGKAALISGGDSGIGKSVAVHFAKEGADVAILYLEETEDALRTRELVEKEGRRCVLMKEILENATSASGPSARPSRPSASSISWSTMPPSSTSPRNFRRSPPSSWSRRSAPTCSACFN